MMVRAADAALKRARVMVAMTAVLHLLAAHAQPAAEGVPRTDANSLTAHAQLVSKAHSGHIDVYFLGDSITRRWGTADEQYRELYANWVSNFHGWNAADFGWGGDTTWNILWRIQHGELDGVNPRVIVLLAGTNDLTTDARAGLGPDQIVAHTVAGLAAIVQVCRAKARGATLILTSIAPRTDHAELSPLIERINERLAQMARGRGLRYLDLGARLTDATGAPRAGTLAADGLHFAVAGYQAWADALRPLLTQLLGPKGTDDAAPAPSRDPGAPFPSVLH